MVSDSFQLEGKTQIGCEFLEEVDAKSGTTLRDVGDVVRRNVAGRNGGEIEGIISLLYIMLAFRNVRASELHTYVWYH